MFKILTTEPKEVTAGSALVKFERKSTAKNPVAETDKYRAVVVPNYTMPSVLVEKSWNTETGEFKAPVVADAVFAAAIQEAFFAAAGDILLDYCKANPTATEISEDALTFAAVVSKMQEQQTSQRMNQDQIFTWYDSSATKLAAATRYGADAAGVKKQSALRAKYGAVASNNSGIDAALATKMIAYLSADDLSNPTCAAVAKRLERLSKETIGSDDL